MELDAFAAVLRLWLVVSVARQRRITHHVETGRELGPLVDVPPAEVEDRLHDALAAIDRYETAYGRPLLTSLVVSSVTSRPTDGYFASAAAVGLEVPAGEDGRAALWDRQVELVFRQWER